MIFTIFCQILTFFSYLIFHTKERVQRIRVVSCRLCKHSWVHNYRKYNLRVPKFFNIILRTNTCEHCVHLCTLKKNLEAGMDKLPTYENVRGGSDYLTAERTGVTKRTIEKHTTAPKMVLFCFIFISCRKCMLLHVHINSFVFGMYN